MLVKDWMTKEPVTVTKGVGIYDALELMRQKKVRRLPVLDKKGKLVGIVSEKDLLYASPSPATSLSIYEMRYLLSKLTVEQVMSTPVIVVHEDDTLEKAARIMADNKIGGLPVTRGEDELVGIITETDIFKVFLVLLGARQAGLRVTIEVPDVKGMLRDVTSAIAGAGGNIISLGTITGEEAGRAINVIKIQGASRDEVVKALEEIGARVTDVREC